MSVYQCPTCLACFYISRPTSLSLLTSVQTAPRTNLPTCWRPTDDVKKLLFVPGWLYSPPLFFSDARSFLLKGCN